MSRSSHFLLLQRLLVICKENLDFYILTLAISFLVVFQLILLDFPKKYGNLAFSFPTLQLIFFSYLIILASASKTMLNHGSDSVFSHLLPDFTWNASSVLLYDGAACLFCYEEFKPIEFNFT